LAAVIGGGNAEAEVVKGLIPRQAATPKATATIPAVTSGATLAGARNRAVKPDEHMFNTAVRPLFEAKGKDGYACVQCHATHTLFNGSYATALNVINADKPEESLLLRKPVSTAESEGVVGSRTTAHGGGVRWEVGSPEYNTILNWIRTAK
jgi:hypothetical protein